MPEKRIGILGGTFDPPHRGHLAVAEAVLRQHLADEVWLMVSPLNPLKSDSRISAFSHRLAMSKLAVAGWEKKAPEELRGKIKVSDFENSLPLPSYTANTLRALAHAYPDYRFRLITGEDNLRALRHWKNPREIVERFGLIVYPRTIQNAERLIYNVPPIEGCPGFSEEGNNIMILENEGIVDISSSEIRIRCADDDIIPAEMVTTQVALYIKAHGLYSKQK